MAKYNISLVDKKQNHYSLEHESFIFFPLNIWDIIPAKFNEIKKDLEIINIQKY